MDTRLTDELLKEGMLREIISKIQTMRKEADFNVTDHIAVTFVGSEKIKEVLEHDSTEFSKAVLCDKISYADAPADGVSKDWNINGESVVITIKR